LRLNTGRQLASKTTCWEVLVYDILGVRSTLSGCSRFENRVVDWDGPQAECLINQPHGSFFSTKKFPIERESMPDATNVLKASSGVSTIGSPARLKLVFITPP